MPVGGHAAVAIQQKKFTMIGLLKYVCPVDPSQAGTVVLANTVQAPGRTEIPHLSYCCFVWAINYPASLIRLVGLQKRAARVILGFPYSEPVHAALER